MATFDRWQQVYCLSHQAGLIGNQNYKGTPDRTAKWLAEQLTGFYTRYKEEMGGTWSTVWGPVVFENIGLAKIADNVMYVAANEDNSMFVVCIAGTNANSLYDIFQEDEAVDTTVQWASAFPSLSNRTPSGLNPYLSTGTQLGVQNLLNMKDGTTGKTLAAFLTLAARGSATLIFSGHSLGGALAPTLGLALFNSNGGTLSKSKWANVYLSPTAGPTPGNSDLSTYVAQEFPPVGPQAQPYQSWNKNVWNTLDVVPQAWVVELLQNAPNLYPHSLPWPPKDLQDMIQGKINKSNEGAATGAGPYTRLANQPLVGTFNPAYPVTDKNSFNAQAAYQHLTAYDVLFNVQSVAPSTPVTGSPKRGA